MAAAHRRRLRTPLARARLRHLKGLSLIHIFSANSRNERMPVRNPIVCLIVFVLSCLILAKAYAELNLDGLVYFGEHFRTATALMLIGTLSLFWSASGFFILVIQRLRGVYFKGLAMFTMRQIAAKVNTAFVSLWAVTVLLFFSIVVFSTGFSLATVFSDQLEEDVYKRQVWVSHSRYSPRRFSTRAPVGHACAQLPQLSQMVASQFGPNGARMVAVSYTHLHYQAFCAYVQVVFEWQRICNRS